MSIRFINARWALNIKLDSNSTPFLSMQCQSNAGSRLSLTLFHFTPSVCAKMSLQLLVRSMPRYRLQSVRR